MFYYKKKHRVETLSKCFNIYPLIVNQFLIFFTYMQELTTIFVNNLMFKKKKKKTNASHSII